MTDRRSAPLPKSKGLIYFKKASRFYTAAEASLLGKNFDAAGLAAIHAVISACDALTVSRLGRRSTAQDHGEVLRLLEDLQLPDSFRRQVLDSLSLKNSVEYEPREVTEAEARAGVTRAKRVVEFITRELSKP